MKRSKELADVSINELVFRIPKKEILTDSQLKVIIEFDTYNKIKGNSDITRKNQVYIITRFIKVANKPFDVVTQEDINKFLVKYKGSSLECFKTILKKFFRWYKKPELVEHLKSSIIEEKLTVDKLWTEDDILKLLKVVDIKTRERDQAMVMILYDLALERSALMNLNVGDVFDTGKRIKVKVTGKKRGRIRQAVLECILSADYLRKWLNVHPDGKNPEAPLFVSFSPSTYGKRLNIQAPWFLLKKLRKRAGINKKIWVHLLRHSKATDLYKKGYRGRELQQFLRHSNILMQEKYAHFCDDEINDARFKAETGIERRQRPPDRRVLLAITCPRCGTMNEPTNLYCSNPKCLYALKPSVAKVELAVLEVIRSQWYKNVMESVKKQEKEGVHFPVESVEVEKLAEAYRDMKENELLTPEEREKKILKKLDE